MNNTPTHEIVPPPRSRTAGQFQFPSAQRSDEGALKKITILIADDHAPVRKALCGLLEKEGQFEVVGQAVNGLEAVKLAQTLRPDVILMDLAMPELNGLEATRQILAVNPGAKVLILSAYDDNEYIANLTAIGAVGFLKKASDSEFLAEAIREVAKGNRYFGPSIAKRSANKGK